ncbi:MAG: reverse transcriptase-like protein [Nitrosopumilus sp.]|nr:reverse transcriptase-like protein [Nitrosopumilus sp.]CAI9832256.1 putative RNase H [Nitrosopumilaceae archaeon]MDA7941819.1 reverse transcriptase-like protein [Nitrosopumilus sp.]MDA7943040.1 reverse transcriptase-like protein [Nitrosopumilus sp.]MDA7945463.1 reverse transcriptase-like protein [Nitrosopumilus sp.]
MIIYVDGSGGPRGGFGYYAEDGSSRYEERPGITSNQAEYLAVIAALEGRAGQRGLVICSDSQVTVNQLNHKYAINSRQLRDLARQAWSLMAEVPGVEIRWVPRGENPAGKMMGS